MRRYLIQTFGCQMNVHDSERMEQVLIDSGYSSTDDPMLADLVLFNTCSVREKAEQKLRSALGNFRALKELRPDLVIAVAGCLAQQEGAKLLSRVPFVDLVVGPDNIPELPALVQSAGERHMRIARTVFDVENPDFLSLRPGSQAIRVSNFVTVMKGCDERCSFCIVPYTRGPERYRSRDSIVAEIKALVDGGAREITLLGQTVNSWYEPSTNSSKISEFPALLRSIADQVPNLVRLRYTSPHPRHLTGELVDAHGDIAILPEHVHMPVQSGSDRILKRMIRRYTRGEYLERIEALRTKIPGMTVSTDVIVGFSGETDSDFEQTLSLIAEARFSTAFAFKYSPRPYTPALKLEDDVPEHIKDERLEALFKLVESQQMAHLKTLVDSETQVLVEGTNTGQDTGALVFTGRSHRHEIVHLARSNNPAIGHDLMGALVRAKVIKANKHSLLAEPLSVISRPITATNWHRPTPQQNKAGRLKLQVVVEKNAPSSMQGANDCDN